VILTPYEAERLEQYKDNFELFAEDCERIKDHDTMEILPLIFNKGQRIHHRVAEKQKSEQGNVRILLLKSRRFGGSTYVEGRYYWLSSLNDNRSTFIIGHEEASTDTLYAMATLMHERNILAPATLRSSAKELLFDDEKGEGLKSQYKLAVAKNVEAGKSQGIHYLHLSEEAMYQGGGHELLSGLLQCVPDLPTPTEIFRETTAKGYGNSFQVDCMKAFDNGKTVYYEEDGIPYAWSCEGFDYILVFIPWFVHLRYSRDFKSSAALETFKTKLEEKVFDKESLKWIDSEPKKLQKRYNITLEQLNWREWAIENRCRGSIDIFHQEYPSTVLEAFLSKGSSVYSPTLCDDAERWCCEPLLTGTLIERNGKVKVRPVPNGHFRLWENPQSPQHKNHIYFITCDPGGGIRAESMKEAEKRDPDPTCIDVWNHTTKRQAAQWQGHIDYDQIDEIVEMVGNLFIRKKLPMACVEQNNHGWAVVKGLKEKNYPMYEHRSGDPGYLTNKVTKPEMVDHLRKDVRSGNLIIRCLETVNEMRTFKEVKGIYGAESGCHDDRVMTACMASQMFRAIPLMSERDSRGEGIQNFKMKDKPVFEGYQEVSA